MVSTLWFNFVHFNFTVKGVTRSKNAHAISLLYFPSFGSGPYLSQFLGPNPPLLKLENRHSYIKKVL